MSTGVKSVGSLPFIFDHIPFAPELLGYIISGLKLTTYRLGNKYDYLKVGDVVSIQDSANKNIVGQAVIKNKQPTTFKKLPLKSYKNKEHQRQVFQGNYAYLNRPIKDTDQFLVFKFELKTVQTQ